MKYLFKFYSNKKEKVLVSSELKSLIFYFINNKVIKCHDIIKEDLRNENYKYLLPYIDSEFTYGSSCKFYLIKKDKKRVIHKDELEKILKDNYVDLLSYLKI
jgi:hypothetical protein